MSACLGVAIGPIPIRSISYADVIDGGNSIAQQPVQYMSSHNDLLLKKSPISHHLRSISGFDILVVAGVNFVLFILYHPTKINCYNCLSDSHKERPFIEEFDNLVNLETTIDV